MKKRVLFGIQILMLSGILVLSGCNSVTDLSFKPIKFNEIELVNESIEQSLDGRHNIYQVRIKNTSDKILDQVTLELIHQDGQHVKILTEDTLKPGDISELMTCIGPTSGELEDISPLQMDVTIINKDFSRERVSYNNETKVYQMTDEMPLNVIESDIDVHQLLVKLEVGYNELDELEQLAYLQNSTNNNVSNVRFKYELADGNIILLSYPNTINRSQKIQLNVTSKLPLTRIKEMTLKEVTFTQEDENEPRTIRYDASLDQYFEL